MMWLICWPQINDSIFSDKPLNVEQLVDRIKSSWNGFLARPPGSDHVL